MHNAIREVSKGNCIIKEDYNHGNIKWDTLKGTGVEYQKCLYLVQDNFLTQHVLEPTRAARALYLVLSTHEISRGHRLNNHWAAAIITNCILTSN